MVQRTRGLRANSRLESENLRHPFDHELCQFGDDQSLLAVWLSWQQDGCMDDESKPMFSEDGRRIVAFLALTSLFPHLWCQLFLKCRSVPRLEIDRQMTSDHFKRHLGIFEVSKRNCLLRHTNHTPQLLRHSHTGQ